MRRILLILLSLSVISAAACKSSSTKKAPEGGGDLNLAFDLATEVPELADHYQIVGVDAEGRVVYGPIYLPKSAQVMLTGVPANVANIQVAFLIGTTPIGMVSAPVDLSSGSAMVDLTETMVTEVEELLELTVSPLEAEVAVRGVQDFQVDGRFSDGASYDLTDVAEWRSSDSAIASVDTGGRATGNAVGSASITAAIGTVASQAALLTVTAPVEPERLPTVASVNPGRGPNTGGTVVTIAGTNLFETTVVSFGSSPAVAFTVNSDTEITATSPAAPAGTVHVQVSTPDGTSVFSAADEFTFFALPEVSSVSPRSGPQAGGDTIVIVGSAFTGATGVSFGGNPARSFNVDSDSQITAVAPAGAGTVDVRVITANGNSPATASDRYRYLPVPAVSNLNPGNGPESGGNPVVLTGTGFEEVATVSFGGTLASFNVDSSTQLTATAPAGSGTVRVTLTTPGGTSAGLDYAYLAIPALTELDPEGGPRSGGNQVTLLGSGFTGATGVSFGSVPASSFNIVSDTELTVVAPAGTGTVRVTVLTPGGNSNGLDYLYAPPPVVSELAPASGPEAGGNPVKLTGTGFSGATSVRFGSAAASAFAVVSDTELTVTAPPGTGSVGVTVTTVGGTSEAAGYQYLPIPALINLVPDAGPEGGGTYVTLLGSGFSGATGVDFAGTAAVSFTVVSDAQIDAIAPPGSGTIALTVVNPSGASNSLPYSYVPAPTLSELSPATGPEVGGNPVLLTGTGFAGATAVRFGGVAAPSFTVVSETQIEAVAPAGSGPAVVTVTTAGGTSNEQTYTYAPGPSLIELAPESGPEAGGNIVVLTGGDFTGTSAVQFGATPASSFTVESAGEIHVVAPAGTGTVDVSVTASGGTSNVLPYTYAPVPELTSVTPVSGPVLGGNEVILSGAHLTGASEVHFGGVPATSFVVNSDTEIVALAPPGSGIVEVEVTTAGGTSDSVPYAYASAALLAGLTPAVGPAVGGNTVTLVGSGLAAVTSVNFGATSVTFLVVSDSELTAIAPPGVGTVDVTATTPIGISNAIPYQYADLPSLTALTPSSGPAAGGNAVVLAGAGLSGATAVSFGAVPATSFTVDSASQITAIAPAGTGTVIVTVTGTGGVSTGLSYTYLSVPTLTSLSPEVGPVSGGTIVVLTGSGFAGALEVAFGDAAATSFTVNSDTEISAVAPAGSAGIVALRVTTPGGVSEPLPYKYEAAPVLTSLTPSSGPTAGGTLVTILGSGFELVSSVQFGSTDASFTTVSATEMTVVAPPGSGTLPVTVTNAGGTSNSLSYQYAALPLLVSVTPSTGPTVGGNSITLAGAELSGATAVSFGGVAATSFTVISESQISAIAPAGSGTVSVTVTTAGGESSGVPYTYAFLPALSGVLPPVGPAAGGNTVAISGTALTGATAVMFGSAAAPSFTVISDTQMAAIVPAGAGTVDVTVTTPGGTAGGATYTYISAPTISSVTPPAGPMAGGNEVTIAGTGLTTTTDVIFGSSGATFTVQSDSTITAIAPPGGGVVDVTLVTVAGTVTAAGAYSYVSTPVLAALTPSGGPLSGGTPVVITGIGLENPLSVTFGGAPATIVNATASELLVTTPPAAVEGTVVVLVTTVGGVSTPLIYTYVAAPEIFTVTPSVGPMAGGNTVTIEGADLSTADGVYFGLEPATAFTVVSDFEISAVAPPGSGLVGVTVTTLGGSATEAEVYTYAPVPTVGTLSATAGPLAGGNVVTISGAGFTAATAVSFGGTPATFTIVSDTQIQVTVPAGTGTVDVTVTSGGGTSNSSPYTYVGVPTVSSPSPSAGPASGGNPVTLTGSGFSTASAVMFGGTPATSFTVVSDTEIIAIAPAGSGNVNITVTTAGGTSSGVSYTYALIPALTSLSPSAGPYTGGNTVTLAGSGFTGATAVSFGVFPALAFTVTSDTQIDAIAPPGAGTVDVTVSTAGGTSNGLTYAYALTPLLTSVSPSSGAEAGGTTALISGGSLTGATAVLFGGVPALAFSVLSDSQITVTVPPGTGTVSLTVTTPGGTATGANYTYLAAPAIASLTPPAGPGAGGTTVSIEGTGFQTASQVLFGTSPAVFTVVSDTQITAVSPAGSGVVDVTVSTQVGSDTAVGAYSYVSTPVLTALTPVGGPASGGNVVVITGVGLTGTLSVLFDGISAPYTVNSDSEISAIAANFGGEGVAQVQVFTVGGGSNSLPYTYVNPPEIVSVTPSAGPVTGGTTVTIGGTDLSTADTVLFGALPATAFTVVSDFEITAIAPPGTGVVDVTVATLGGIATESAAYSYASAAILSSLSPSAGPLTGGGTVLITGSGLTGTSAVTFGAMPSPSFVVMSDAQIAAMAPLSATAGTVSVVATTAGGTSNALSYTYVVTPTLDSATPSSGPATGGNTVTLTGTGFTDVTMVTFSGALAPSFTINSDTQITATVPAGSGTVNLNVSSAGGTSNSLSYTFLSEPTLISVVPNSGAPSGGTVVTVTGTGFTGATAVSFGGVPATSFTVDADTQITAVTPAGTGTVNLTVTTPGGTSSAISFTYAAAPTLSSLDPSSGPSTGGNTVTLNGSGFTGATLVMFGFNTAIPAVLSDTQITVIAPPMPPLLSIPTASVTVMTPAGVSNALTYTYQTTPTLFSAIPNIGPAAGGTTVILTGSYLSGATSVMFGSTPATSFSTVVDSQIIAIAPAGTGTVNVTVTTASGTSSGVTYTYLSPPTVSTVTPPAGPVAGGNAVTITGTALSGTSQVMFGSTATTFSITSDTEIVALAPPGSGTVDISVTTAYGTGTAPSAYSYVTTPVLVSLTPSAGPVAGANMVVVSGVGLSGATAVTFNGVAATVINNSDTEIAVTAPAGAAEGEVAVVVSTVGGSSNSLTYTYVSMPVVDEIEPTAGPQAGGNTVVILGTDLATASSVAFGIEEATFTVVSDNNLSVIVPAGTGVVDVTVVTAGGSSTSSSAYTYVAAPAVASVTPSQGPSAGGTTVTLTGIGLLTTNAVLFGGNPAPFTVVSDTQISAVAPAGAGTVLVTVITAGGITVALDPYSYEGAPEIVGPTPNAGPLTGGNTVTITGTNLATASAVSFGGIIATPSVLSATEITVVVPAGSAPGSVTVTVTTAGGTSNTLTYTYAASPTLISATPNAGAPIGGSIVTLTGTGLTGTTAVSFGATPATAFTVDADTQITAISPAGTVGTVGITVTSAGGSSNAISYTYAPAPTLSSIVPDGGPITGGGMVTLTGTGFTGTTAVTFGLFPTTFVVLSDTEISAFVPPSGLGATNVTVTTPGGTSNALPYTFYFFPSVALVTPNSGPPAGGNTVTLTGVFLSGATSVLFGATPATAFTVTSDTQISAVAPAGTGTVILTVITPGGTATGASYTYVAPPTIGTLTPIAGPVAGGNSVTITGAGFTGTTQVMFGSNPATAFTVSSPTEISAIAPAGSGTVDVSVTTEGGTATSAGAYSYVTTPVLVSLTPSAGPVAGGNMTVVSGAGLTGALAVTFNGVAGTIVNNSDSEIVVTAPAGAAEGEAAVVVTTVGGASNSLTYTYVSPPFVDEIEPTAGPQAGGNTVVIVGTDLATATTVVFGTEEAAPTVISDNNLSVVVPAGTGVVDVTVVTAGGSSTLSSAYSYVAGPTLTILTPSAGPLTGGGTVIINGTGLTSTSAVTFGGTPSPAFVVMSDSQVAATAPVSAIAGSVTVALTTAGGASNDLSYTYVATPTLTSVTPNSGPNAGGNTVTLTGTGFYSVTDVTFSGALATVLSVFSDNTMTVSVPGGVGTVSLNVTSAGGTSNGLSYTYAPEPTLIGASPSAGSPLGGTVVTITGAGLTGATGVSFGGAPAISFTVASDAQITAVAPAGAGTVNLTVTTPGGTSNAISFSYAPAPTLSSLTPNGGPFSGGTTVTLTGTGFTGTTQVTFGSFPASYVVLSDTQISAFAPPGGFGAANVTVTTPGGTSNALPYTFYFFPSLATVVPNSGPPAGGNTVTLTGSFLTGATSVLFGATPATSFTVMSDVQISAIAPAGSGTVTLSVVTPGGTALGAPYTYIAAPTISSVTPPAGPVAGGNTVTLTGTGFTGAQVIFGSSLPPFTVVSDTEIVVTAPAGVGVVDVHVSTSGGTATATSAYSYVSTPVVTSLTPDAGPVDGTNMIVVSGAGLSGALAVTFDGVAGTIVSNTDTEIALTVPAGAAEGEVAVVVSTVGGSSNALTYTYVSPPVPDDIEPNAGPEAGGNTVVILGTDLATTSSVSFDGEEATFTVLSDNNLSVIVPAGTGLVDVVVVTAGGMYSWGSAYTYLAAPTLSGVTPAQGPTAGGQVVTLSGTGLASATAVTFDGVPATFVVVSDTQISATTPNGAAGAADVVVTTVGGAATLAGAYTFVPEPGIASPTPNQGPLAGGNTVTISGTNLQTTTSVSFGGVSVTPSTTGPSMVTVVVPAGAAAGPVDVSVTSAGGTSNTASYTYLDAPTLVSATPSIGAPVGGTTVTITGTALLTTDQVTFGGVPATSFTVVSDTQVNATTPSGVGIVDIEVTTQGGSATLIEGFTFVFGPALGTLTPNMGPTAGGNSVVIVGTGLGSALSVTFGGVAGVITANTATSITVTAPAGSEGPVGLIVTTAGGASDPLPYTYVAAPEIEDVTPSAGPEVGGNTITITGFDFNTATAVSFDGVEVTPTVLSDNNLSVVVPAGSGVVDVTVVTVGGSDTLVNGYAYAPFPTVSTVTPAQGPALGGNSVTITGTGFTNTLSVTFDGTEASFVALSDTQISATLPAGAAGSVDVVVTTVGGSATAVSAYTYVTAPGIAGTFPNQGPLAGGNTVTITGTGIGSATAVSFGGITVTPTVQSATLLTVIVPASAAAQTVPVYVTNPGGDSNNVSYTYLNVPTVTTLSPVIGPADGGTTVTITGTALSSATAVTFGGVAATAFTVDSDTQITAITPVGLGIVDVVVTTAGGSVTVTEGFTFAAAPGPGPMTPILGPLAGGNPVTITGTNLSNVLSVTFGGVAATITANTPTQIDVVAPPGAEGPVTVLVTAAGGSGTTLSQYTYVPLPEVEDISPSVGAPEGGNTVIITGFELSTAFNVSFGANNATPTVISDNNLSVVVPAGTGIVDVTVTTAGGTDTLAEGYSYVSTPTLIDSSPAEGPVGGGTVVSILGTGLDSVETVTFDGVSAVFTIVSATQINATTPAGTGLVDIAVTSPGGPATLTDAFTYVAAPTISTLSSTTGTLFGGNTITITGTGLSGATSVSFGPNSSTPLSSSATQVSVVVPAGVAPGPMPVTVTTAGGTSNALSYTYVGIPSVTTVSPDSGPAAGGSTVTITGTALATTSEVTFGGTPATAVTVVSDSQVTATLPAGSVGFADVVVTTAGGSATVSEGFLYIAAAGPGPMTPIMGPLEGGNPVTITGTNLANAISVTFGGNAASIQSNTPTMVAVLAPAGLAGSVPVIVTTAGGSGSTLSPYTYVPPPEIEDISPSDGALAGGETITITGFELSTATSVSFGANAAIPTVISDNNLSVVVPAAGSPGLVNVTVTTAGGSDTLVEGYNYVSTPTFSSVVPDQGPIAGGTLVQIFGTGLSDVTSVTFDSTPALFTIVSDSQINATAPAGIGIADINLTSAGGTATGIGVYSWLSVPTITTLSSTMGPTAGGNTITITGTALTTATSVSFGPVSSPPFSVTATQLSVVVPAGAASGTAPVTVSTGGGSSNALSYTYVDSATISGLTPTTGPTTGGTTVVITGTALTTTSGVTFGATPATSFTVDSDTQITAVSPAGVGLIDLVVTTAAGSATIEEAFQYFPEPDAGPVNPAQGATMGGTFVVLTGTNLGTVLSVTFDGTPASILSSSANTINLLTPPHAAGPVAVIVTTQGGSSTSPNTFTYVNPPELEEVSPTAGPEVGGNTVTITGFELSTAMSVAFGGTEATPTVLSDNNLSVTVPAGIGTVDVTVITAGGTDTLVDEYTYVSDATLTNVTPAQGAETGGTAVTLLGTGFSTASSVLFNGTPAVFTVVSDNQLNVTTPAGTGTAIVTIVTGAGPQVFVEAFNYIPAPTFTGLTPTAGPIVGGNIVTITGANLGTATLVSFGGNGATPSVMNSTTIMVNVPEAGAPGSVPVTVTTAGGTASVGTYLYVGAPTIVSVTPTVAPPEGGTTVTITGTGFNTAEAVFFGANPAADFSVDSDTQITAIAPAGSGTVDLTVVTAGGSVSVPNVFSYVPVPLAGPISPNMGPLAGGTLVTLTGLSLGGATSVTFDGLPAAILANTANMVTVETPAHAAGQVQVIITTPGGSANANPYTYVVPPGLDDVIPSGGPVDGGNVVVITGSDLSTASLVSFGFAGATPFEINDDNVSVVVPAGVAGVVDVTVTTGGGTDTLADAYTYAEPPTVAAVTPNQGPILGGNSVTITGTSFTTAQNVTFGGVQASLAVNSDSEIIAIVPAGAAPGPVDVVVTNIAGSASAVEAYSYVAAPALAAANPSAGPLVGGNLVTITGTNLAGATSVTFGPNSATPTVINSTQLMVVAPAGAAAITVPVTVTTPGGTSEPVAYTYVEAPIVSAVEPTVGGSPGGTSVTIDGAFLSGTTEVLFGGIPAVYTVVSNNQIIATTPGNEAGPVDLTVTTPGGSATVLGAFTYVNPPGAGPITPAEGPVAGGNSVFLFGTNFGGALSVTFDGLPGIITSNTATSLTVTAPAHVAGTVLVVITTAGGSATANPYTYVNPPEIEDITPVGGPEAGGNTVTITGFELSLASNVIFGSEVATPTVIDDNNISVIVPAGTGTVDVTVMTPGGDDTIIEGYTYAQLATVFSFGPNNGPTAGGNATTLTGISLGTTSSVTFDGVPALFTVNSDTQLLVTVPAGTAGPADVVVTNLAGSTMAVGAYTYVDPPTIMSMVPNQGPLVGGNTVTITGTNLTGASLVLVDGVSAVPTVNSATELTFTVPEGSTLGARPLVVMGVGGPSDVVPYTYLAAPTVSTLSAIAGPEAGGTTVTIDGTGLATTTQVTFGGDVSTSVVVLSDTQIQAVAPASTSGPGAVDLVVTTLGGSATLVGGFTYVFAPGGGPLNPNAGPIAGGTTVVISGVNLSSTSSVTFDGLAAAIVANTPSQVTVVTPAHAEGAVDVVITTPGGSTNAGSQYTYASPPEIDELSMTAGPEAGGNTLTITGFDLATTAFVSIGGVEVTPFETFDDNVSITVPAGMGTQDVTIVTAGGSDFEEGAYTYVPVPILGGLSPNQGPLAGGNTVTIVGDALSTTAEVTFDGLSASFITVSNTQLVATPPAHALGSVDVVITTAGGSATEVGGYTYILAPALSAITPSGGSIFGGNTVTITGANLAGATSVSFGGTLATPTVISATQLSVSVPESQEVGPVAVTVTTPGGTSGTVTYTYVVPPFIDTLAPTVGAQAGGTAVTIMGNGFATTQEVTFGGTPALFTVVSDSLLNVTAPASATNDTVNVAVSTLGGTYTQSTIFTYVATPGPGPVSPNMGPLEGGNPVTIIGTNLANVQAVTFGGVAANIWANTPTSISVDAPAGVEGPTEILVTTPGGTAATTAIYSYVMPPVAEEFDRTVGSEAGGEVLTITGFDLENTFYVMFGPSMAIPVSVSDNNISVVVPSGSGTVNVTVVGAGGSDFLEEAYTYAPTPTLTGVSPSSGPETGGNTVTLTGLGLTYTTDVSFGGASGSFVVVSDMELTATVPAGFNGFVNVVVTSPAGSATIVDGYRYIPQPAIVVSPNAGPLDGGQPVTITGTNLQFVTAVSFGGVPAASFTVQSPTQINVVSPTNAPGPVDLTVTSPGGTSDPVTYTYVSAPTFTSVTPAAGPLAGGNSVTITGTNLGNTLDVAFPIGSGIITANTPTSVTVAVPAGAAAGPGLVGLTTWGGNVSFIYTYLDVPSVTSVAPTGGPEAGENAVTITGSAFTTAQQVWFGDSPAVSFMVVSDTEITATAPSGSGVVNVIVVTLGGTHVENDGYEYLPIPLLSSVNPPSGPEAGGTSVTLTGSGFDGVTGVFFDGEAADYAVVSSTEIIATTPAGSSGAVDLWVETLGGVTNAITYTYVVGP